MGIRRKLYRAARRHKWKIISTLFLLAILYFLQKTNTSTSPLPFQCQPIDVVYTWVNGTDPSFINSIQQFDESYDKTRFDDKSELKYSLRSLEKYAPWIRHIYIVTNGQIPKWLDLTNERITIVPHEVLIPNLQWLPTFSSSAIETFLHRIPNLSERFLYLNDDIFLGAQLYPEDLYTDSEGVRIYQAWLVPDCAEDCPWTYIGDGACDRHCNLPQCQYDGNDCVNDVQENRISIKNMPTETTSLKTELLQTKELPLLKLQKSLKNLNKLDKFRDILFKHKNLTNKVDMKSVVEIYNQQFQANALVQKEVTTKQTPTVEARKTPAPADTYSQSLIYTNMLLNHRYGFKARHVMDHVGFLLQKSIIENMHLEFATEIAKTAKNRFRTSNDLQFAFLYYSFVMGETYRVSIADIFNEFDTDRSQTWSDREIRTFFAKTFPLPLDWKFLHFFEEVIQNCTFTYVGTTDNIEHTTIMYERYQDSHLPTITSDFVQQCAPLAKALIENFGLRKKYKFHINSKRNIHSNFMMLTSNVSDVVEGLDRIRKYSRKFNCINDNLDHQYDDENEIIRNLLDDFYLSLFPHRSQYELQPQFRNRFDNWRDYLKWRRQQRAFLVIIYGSSIFILIYLVRSLCIHKSKFVRRCIQKL